MRHALVAILMFAAGSLWADPVSDLIAGTLDACRGCDLQDADFKKADLSGVDLTGANLSGASFHRANLRGAILEEVTAVGTNFNLAELTQARMGGGTFTRAMFYGAQLSGADLSAANLAKPVCRLSGSPRRRWWVRRSTGPCCGTRWQTTLILAEP